MSFLDFMVDSDAVKHSRYQECIFIEFFIEDKSDFTQCLHKIVEPQ